MHMCERVGLKCFAYLNLHKSHMYIVNVPSYTSPMVVCLWIGTITLNVKAGFNGG